LPLPCWSAIGTAAVFNPMYEGTIRTIVADRGYGFIVTPNQPDCFFHMSDVVDLEWGEQLTELRVRFDIIGSPKGPRAKNVRAAI
jgi:cold shock CspA family protein